MIFLVNSQYENERKETNEKSDGKNKGQYFCRLPALLLCALLLSACGSGDKAEAASGDPGESAASVENTGEAISEPVASAEAPEGVSSSEVQETVPEQTSASKDRLDGTIEEIDSSSFRVSETFTEDLGEDGLLAVSPADPDPTAFIEVTYTEDTVFTICSSSDMGITSTTSEATAADLEKEGVCTLQVPATVLYFMRKKLPYIILISNKFFC